MCSITLHTAWPDGRDHVFVILRSSAKRCAPMTGQPWLPIPIGSGTAIGSLVLMLAFVDLFRCTMRTCTSTSSRS